MYMYTKAVYYTARAAANEGPTCAACNHEFTYQCFPDFWRQNYQGAIPAFNVATRR